MWYENATFLAVDRRGGGSSHSDHSSNYFGRKKNVRPVVEIKMDITCNGLDPKNAVFGVRK